MSAPLIAAATVWLGAWLRGAAAPDDVLEALALAAPDAPAVVHLDGAPPAPMTDLLRVLRGVGSDSAWLILPRPGRTIGWPAGAPGESRPAVLVGRRDCCVGMVSHGSAGWRWDTTGVALPAALQAAMLTSRSGARALAAAVTASAERLEPMGLERPASAPAPRAWRAALGRLPRRLDPRVDDLLIRIGSLHDALDLALADDGSAVTAAEARARTTAITGLLGSIEDVLAGIVGGLNAPALVPGPGR